MASKEDIFAPISVDEKAALLKEEEIFARPTEDEFRAMFAEPPVPIEDKAMAFASGMGESATFGYLPEIQAAVQPAIEAGLEFATGTELDPRQKDSTYDERVIAARQQQHSIQDTAPGYALAGELAGFVAPGVGIAKTLAAGGKVMKGARLGKVLEGTRGAGMATKGMKLEQSRAGQAYAAEKILETAGQVGPMSTRIPGLAVLGAAEGYLYNPKETGMSRGDAAASTAIFGGAIPVAGSALKKLPDVAKSALHIASGVEVKNMNKYLRNPELLDNAQDLASVKAAVDDVIRPIRQEVENAEINLSEAKERVSRVERNFREGFRDKTKEINQAFAMAKTDLDLAYKSNYDQMNRVRPPIHIVDDIVEAQAQLKRDISEGSGKAFDILHNEMGDTLIPITNAVDAAKAGLDDVLIQGQTTQEGKVWAENIQGLIENLEGFEQGLSPREMKKYIQQLDQSLELAYDANTWKLPDMKTAKAVRSALDDILKQNDSYRTVMAEVAPDLQLYNAFRQKAGNPEKIERLLNRIDKPNNNYERELLNNFLNRTNKSVGEDVLEYVGIKNQVKELSTDFRARDQFKETLPEAIPYNEALYHIKKRDAMEEAQKRLVIEQQVKQSQEMAELQLAEDRLSIAVDAKSRIVTFTERNSENKIKSLIRVLNNGKDGGGITIKEEFKKLSSMTDVDFEEIVEGLALNRAFDKEFLRGQRNVGLWSVLGTAVGAGMGFGSGNVFMGSGSGLAVGAMIGAVMDMHGPALTKKMLGAVITIKGLPTRSKIMNLDLPPRAKMYLINDFEATMLSGWAGSPMKIDPEDIPAIREDVRRNDEFPPDKKAKIIDDLNRSGKIRDPKELFGEVEIKNEKSELEEAILNKQGY